MKDLSILGLVWDSFNEAHIWERHQLTRAEVEEVAYGPPENLYARQTYGGRSFCHWTKSKQTTDCTDFSIQGIREILPGQCATSR